MHWRTVCCPVMHSLSVSMHCMTMFYLRNIGIVSSSRKIERNVETSSVML